MVELAWTIPKDRQDLIKLLRTSDKNLLGRTLFSKDPMERLMVAANIHTPDFAWSHLMNDREDSAVRAVAAKTFYTIHQEGRTQGDRLSLARELLSGEAKEKLDLLLMDTFYTERPKRYIHSVLRGH